MSSINCLVSSSSATFGSAEFGGVLFRPLPLSCAFSDSESLDSLPRTLGFGPVVTAYVYPDARWLEKLTIV